MQIVVMRVGGFVGVALAAMVAALVLRVAQRAPRAAIDPWAPRPTVHMPRSHGWPPDDVEDLTASARHMLGRVFALRVR